MAFYSCSVCEEDGTHIVQNVTVSLEETTRGGVTAWHGTITSKRLTTVATGQKYLLMLPDGRVGEFVVRRNTYAGGEERAVAIRGTGPLALRS